MAARDPYVREDGMIALLREHEESVLYSDSAINDARVVAALVLVEVQCPHAHGGMPISGQTTFSVRVSGHPAVVASVIAQYFVDNPAMKPLVDGAVTAIRMLRGGHPS